MKISEYIKKYTKNNKLSFGGVAGEFGEFIVELLKFNKIGIKEEWQDFLLFLQGWLWSDFKIDGEVWKSAKESADKFADRKEIWREIYRHVGLENINSGYVGNYKRVEKVIKHLSDFGIEEKDSKDTFNKIVLNK